MAQRVVASVLVEEAGQEPGLKVGAVGLVDQAAPGVRVEAVDAFAEDGVRVEAFSGE